MYYDVPEGLGLRKEAAAGAAILSKLTNAAMRSNFARRLGGNIKNVFTGGIKNIPQNIKNVFSTRMTAPSPREMSIIRGKAEEEYLNRYWGALDRLYTARSLRADARLKSKIESMRAAPKFADFKKDLVNYQGLRENSLRSAADAEVIRGMRYVNARNKFYPNQVARPMPVNGRGDYPRYRDGLGFNPSGGTRDMMPGLNRPTNFIEPKNPFVQK